MRNNTWLKAKGVLALTLAGLMLVSSAAPAAAKPTTVYANDRRAEIEKSLYNAEYYAKANEDVAVALNNDPEALYQHWLNYGKAEGRNASMVFNAKYYLEVNQDVAAVVGAENYTGAYEHFVTSGLLEGRESSPVFSVTYYLQANTDVANAFNNDYVMAAQHFNESAIAEGRSGSGNFDYTVYRACNTDVGELYGDYVQGYYIHYINHGRAEGRTGGLGVNNSGSTGGSGNTGGDTGNTGGSTGGSTEGIDTTAPSWRIFDANFYVERYPELATTVGTDATALYQYWMTEGIAKGQTASPVIVPAEYLELNADVAEVFGGDEAAALNHFLNYGITEGRTGSKEFDYSIYASCNTDVGGVFADDIVGYYFHYVKYGKAENRTAAVYIPEEETIITVEGPENGSAEIVLNGAGQMTEQTIYNEAGEVLSVNTVTYDNEGRLSRIQCKDENKKALGNVTFYWDDDENYLRQATVTATGGDVIAAIEVAAGATTYQLRNTGYRTVYVQAEQGYQKTYQYKPSGSLEYLSVYQRNENNQNLKYWRYKIDRLIEYSEYVYTDGVLTRVNEYNRENGRLTGYSLYEYYADGTRKAITNYTADGEFNGYSKYDEEGRQIAGSSISRSVTYNNGVEVLNYKTETVRAYNPSSIISCIRYDKNDNVIWTTEYEYDVNGKLMAEYRTTPDGTLDGWEKYEYYDSGVKKQVTEYYGEDTLVVVYRYKEDGTVESAEGYSYNSDRERTSYYEAEYNEAGKEVLNTYYDPVDTGTEKYHYIYEYDQYNQTSKQTKYNPDGTVLPMYLYEDGNRTEYYSYGYSEGVLYRIYHYKYNVYGDQITYAVYDANEELISSEEYEYNEYGDRISCIRYDENGEIDNHYGYEYDLYGRKTVQITYINGVESQRNVYTYDESGYCILDKVVKNGKVNSSTGYEYDAQGYKTKQITYDGNGKISSYIEYEYYANGRTKKQTYYNMYASEIMKNHVYEYYETGRTKSYYYYTNQYDSTAGKYVLKQYSVKKYDEVSGKVTIEEVYNSNDTLTSYYTFEYNDAGKEIGKTQYNTNGTILSEQTTEYYDNGKTKSKKTYQAGTKETGWLQSVYEYNEAGATTRNATYKEDGSVSAETLWEYHDNGKQKLYETYKDGGKETGWLSSRQEYNEAGKSTSVVFYSSDGVLSSEQTTEYYDNGNRKNNEYVSYKDGSISNVSLTEYYDNGNQKYSKSVSYKDGSVSSVSLTEYYDNGNLKLYQYYKDGDEETGWLNYFRECNEDGNETRYVSYSSDGVVSYETLTEYHENGNKKSQKRYKDGDEETGWLNYMYEYNEDGNTLRYVSYSAEETISYMDVYEYNEVGNETRHVHYNSAETISYVNVYEYPENGNKIKKYYRNGDEETGVLYELTEYNESGQEIKHVYYNSDGSINYTMIIEYHENGNEKLRKRYEDGDEKTGVPYAASEYNEAGESIKYVKYNSDGTVQYEREYYENGYQKSYTYYYYSSTGELNYYYVTLYDETGSSLGTTYYNPDGSER